MPQPFRLTSGSSLFLDLLRGLSAQAVLIGHGLYFFDIHGPGAAAGDFFVHRYAVGLFFILSGFLIAYSTRNKVEADRPYGFGHFFIDRFSRIYTALVPALLLIALLDAWHVHYAPEAYTYYSGWSWHDFVGNLLMLQYFPGLGAVLGARIDAFGSGATLWTLSIEWWIYMAFGWGALQVFASRRLAPAKLLIWLPLLIVPVAGFGVGRPAGLMIIWLFGLAGYWLFRGGFLAGVDRLRLALLGGLAVAAAVLRFYVEGEEYDAVLMALSTCIILIGIRFFDGLRWPAWLSWSSRTVAAYSYTLYLVHYSILDLLRTTYGAVWSSWTLFFVGCLLANAVAAAVGLYVETTLTRRAKNYLYTRIQ